MTRKTRRWERGAHTSHRSLNAQGRIRRGKICEGGAEQNARGNNLLIGLGGKGEKFTVEERGVSIVLRKGETVRDKSAWEAGKEA